MQPDSLLSYRLTGAVPQGQHLNHHSTNFTIQKQLCQYLIFSLYSFLQVNVLKSYLMLKTTQKNQRSINCVAPKQADDAKVTF